MNKTILVSVMALGMSASWLPAQLSPGRYLAPVRQDPNRPAAPALAGTPAATPRPSAAQGPVVSPLVAAIDTNHNGVVEAGEIVNVPEALKTLDKNGDGKLTPDEYLGQGESPASPLVKVLDVNGNGIIEAKEMAGAGLSLRMLDRNGDGKLTPSEFRSVRASATSSANAPSSTAKPAGK